MRLEDYIESKEQNTGYKKIIILIILLILLFFTYNYYKKISIVHRIFMSTDKLSLDKVTYISEESEYNFNLDEDFFLFYKKGWSTPEKITLIIYQIKDVSKIEYYKTTRKFKQSSNKIQMYFDDTFFETAGIYEVEILNQENEILAIKRFNMKENPNEK